MAEVYVVMMRRETTMDFGLVQRVFADFGEATNHIAGRDREFYIVAMPVVEKGDDGLPTGSKRVFRVTEHGRKVMEVKCRHGFWVACEGFTNTCEFEGDGEPCDYNGSGQHLASRSAWGEETGETANDILMAEAAGFPELDD